MKPPRVPAPSANATATSERHPGRAESTVGSTFRLAILRQEASLLLVLALVVILAATQNSSFLGTDNVMEVLRTSSVYFVMACGAAMLIIGGGLDFSVGAVFTLGALTCTSLLVAGVPVAASIVGGLAAGSAAGLANHLVVARLHVPPIIATLGTFFILSGITTQMTGGLDVLPLPEDFTNLARGQFLGISVVIWYALAVGLFFWFLLEKTPYGINTRALGGNRAAALANGLPAQGIDMALYVVAGLMGALAGIIYSARIGAGQVEAGGSSITLAVITATLIGGISLLGGLGSITGVAIGAVLMATINNALIIAKIPPQYNTIVVGSILIGAVALDHVRRRQLYRPS